MVPGWRGMGSVTLGAERGRAGRVREAVCGDWRGYSPQNMR